MPNKDHELNRQAWNNMVDVHVNHSEYKTAEVISGGSSLKRIELETFGDVKGKSMLHLMCQFGLDTLSWVREGAIVTGIDISDTSIKRANEIKAKAGLKADFIRSDIFDLEDVLDKQFDLVYQSYGTHCWISDIKRWGKVVARYLKPGGTFFLIDDHPVKVQFYNPPLGYFDMEPERDSQARDYCDRDHIIDGTLVEWQHPLACIINALIEAGLLIERLDEYAYSYYREEENWTPDAEKNYWLPPGGPAKYPLMFSLKARKV